MTSEEMTSSAVEERLRGNDEREQGAPAGAAKKTIARQGRTLTRRCAPPSPPEGGEVKFRVVSRVREPSSDANLVTCLHGTKFAIWDW